MICPKCNTDNGVEIVYGFPTITLFHAQQNKEIYLGGCTVFDAREEGGSPKWHCFSCGNEWGRYGWLDLNNFELEIEERIVDRGYKCFLQNRVSSLKHNADKNWVAIVEGTNNYIVSVDILNKKDVCSYECNCPYFEENEIPCKHIVAVLYALIEKIINNK